MIRAFYAQISRVSSFYEWAMNDPDLCQEIPRNPVHLARPKAPKAYQTESTQALSDEEVKALLAVVKAKADTGDIVGKRDYALLLFFFATGMRRSEAMLLRWGDVKINDTVTVTAKVKGGDYVGCEIADPRVKDALLDYLRASGRLGTMDAETPLWTSHDRTKLHTGDRLTGHAFAKRVKVYARWAGIRDVHLHQTRHTFARWVSESTGSIIETQDALGHKHAATTRVYVQRVAVKKDKHNNRELELCKAQQASCQVHQTEKRHLVEVPLNVPHVVIAAKPKECYNSSERSVTMVTVQLSKDEKLILPESLGRSLGLREGDRVEVRRQDDVLWLQRTEMSDVLGPLTDLSRIISSSRPVGSVDVEKIMDKHGYEQIDERSDL